MTLLARIGKTTPTSINDDLRMWNGFFDTLLPPSLALANERHQADNPHHGSFPPKLMTDFLRAMNSTFKKALFGRLAPGRHAGSLRISNNVDMAQLNPDPVETRPPHRVLKEPMVLYHDPSNLSLEAPAFDTPALSYRHVKFGIQSGPHWLRKTRTRESLVLGRQAVYLLKTVGGSRSLSVTLYNIEAAPLQHENFMASRSISRPLPHG